MRATISTTLSCWIAFVLLGAAFAKATEDAPFRAAAHAHALLGTARTLVVVLASLAALAGAVAATGGLVLFVHVGHPRPGSVPAHSALVGWLAVILAAAALMAALMAMLTLAVAVYDVVLALDARSLAASANGPSGTASTTLILTVQLALMAVATGVAAVASRRGRAASLVDA
jgi:hypothetical protein